MAKPNPGQVFDAFTKLIQDKFGYQEDYEAFHGPHTIEMLLDSGAILGRGGSAISAMPNRNEAQVREEFGKRLLSGESFYVYPKGSEYPQELHFDPAQGNFALGKVVNQASKERTMPKKPNALNRASDRVMKLFGRRNETCQVYEALQEQYQVQDRLAAPEQVRLRHQKDAVLMKKDADIRQEENRKRRQMLKDKQLEQRQKPQPSSSKSAQSERSRPSIEELMNLWNQMKQQAKPGESKQVKNQSKQTSRFLDFMPGFIKELIDAFMTGYAYTSGKSKLEAKPKVRQNPNRAGQTATSEQTMLDLLRFYLAPTPEQIKARALYTYAPPSHFANAPRSMVNQPFYRSNGPWAQNTAKQVSAAPPRYTVQARSKTQPNPNEIPRPVREELLSSSVFSYVEQKYGKEILTPAFRENVSQLVGGQSKAQQALYDNQKKTSFAMGTEHTGNWLAYNRFLTRMTSGDDSMMQDMQKPGFATQWQERTKLTNTVHYIGGRSHELSFFREHFTSAGLDQLSGKADTELKKLEELIQGPQLQKEVKAIQKENSLKASTQKEPVKTAPQKESISLVKEQER